MLSSSSIKVSITAHEEEPGVIDKYYYSLDEIDYIESDDNEYTFEGLIMNMQYTAYIRVSNKNGFISNSTKDIMITCSYPEGSTWKYSYTGSPQNFEAPCDAIYKVELWGEAGGSASTTYHGGYGASTTGNIKFLENEILYLYVGAMGTTATGSYSYNGGGPKNYGTSYVGGGATDIRCFYDSTIGKCIENTKNLDWSNSIGLASRIMVSGGGAGVGNYSTSYTIGGSAGGLTGNNGNYYDINIAGREGKGGTQVSGGASPGGEATAGGFGYGGTAGYWSGLSSSSGGSSYISGYQGCVAITSSSSTTPRNDSIGTQCTMISALEDITCSYHYSNRVFTNTVMKSGGEALPTYDGTQTMIGNNNNGYAKITLVSF